MGSQAQVQRPIFANVDPDDASDFFVAVEERFGASISEEEYQHIRTPRDLANLVLTKVECVEPNTCLRQRAFHQLRRAIVRNLGASRTTIRLDTPLEQLIPKKGRRTSWKLLATNVGARKWPELQRGYYTVVAILFAVLAAIVVTFFVGYWKVGTSWPTWLVAVAVAIVLGEFLAFVARPLKTGFPQGCGSVGELVGHIVAENPHLLGIEDQKWTRERVEHAIRNLMTAHTVVTEFDQDSPFFEQPGI